MSEKERTTKIITDTLIKNGADFVALFGSFARGEETSTSDIDVLVNFAKPISLFDHAGIELDLEKKTGRKIDLVTRGAAAKHLYPYIASDLITVYEGR